MKKLLLIFFNLCLRETLERKDNGEKDLTLAERFFKLKIYKLSK